MKVSQGNFADTIIFLNTRPDVLLELRVEEEVEHELLHLLLLALRLQHPLVHHALRPGVRPLEPVPGQVDLTLAQHRPRPGQHIKIKIFAFCKKKYFEIPKNI